MKFSTCPMRRRGFCQDDSSFPIPFRPRLTEAGFARHLWQAHGWTTEAAWQFIIANRQTRVTNRAWTKTLPQDVSGGRMS